MSRIIDKVRGHQNRLSSLLEVVREGRFPQSALFVGPKGIGKYLVARGIAQALVCESSGSPCGKCGSCVRIENSQSENLLVVAPEKSGAATIKVEQARDILNFCHYQTAGQAKVVIIDGAEKLNPQAANALLKTLEEPPPKTHFIIIATSTSSILSTIRSRVQIIRFAPLKNEELDPSSTIPTWVVRSSQGRLDRLNELAEKENSDLRRDSFRLFSSTLSMKTSDVFPMIKDSVKERQNAVQVLAYFQQFLRDMMVLNSGSDQIVHLDLRASYEKFAHLTSDSLDRLFQVLMQIERDIEGNVDRTLTFESYWLLMKNQIEEVARGMD